VLENPGLLVLGKSPQARDLTSILFMACCRVARCYFNKRLPFVIVTPVRLLRLRRKNRDNAQRLK